MKHNTQTPFALTLGASLIVGLSATATHADPFFMTDLSYNQTTGSNVESGAFVKVKDGACGEGKCGGNVPSKVEKPVEDEKSDVENTLDQVIENNDEIQPQTTEDEPVEI